MKSKKIFSFFVLPTIVAFAMTITVLTTTAFTMSGYDVDVDEYKVYTASMSQIGGEDPVVYVLGDNTIGDISWTRIAKGYYKGELEGAFPFGRTYLMINSGTSVRIHYASIDNVIIETLGWSGHPQDGVLTNTSIEIRTYNVY